MSQQVYDLDAMLDPEAHGMEVCSHCAGYGSSLHEAQDRCSQCKGYGLIPKGEG
jgi:DnaJ-class molecular chaperone